MPYKFRIKLTDGRTLSGTIQTDHRPTAVERMTAYATDKLGADYAPHVRDEVLRWADPEPLEDHVHLYIPTAKSGPALATLDGALDTLGAMVVEQAAAQGKPIGHDLPPDPPVIADALAIGLGAPKRPRRLAIVGKPKRRKA